MQPGQVEISRSAMLLYTFILVFAIFMILIAAMDCVAGDSGVYFTIGVIVLVFLPIFMFMQYKPIDNLSKASKTNLMILALITLVSCIFFIVIAAKGCGKNTAAFYGIGIVWMLISAGLLFVLNVDVANMAQRIAQSYAAPPGGNYGPPPPANYGPPPANYGPPPANYGPPPANYGPPVPQAPAPAYTPPAGAPPAPGGVPPLTGGYDNTTTGTLGETSVQQGGLFRRQFKCASWL
jgi:hypothetical protein